MNPVASAPLPPGVAGATYQAPTAPRALLSLDAFRCALAALDSLDRHDLAECGAIAPRDGAAWHRWRSNPATYLLRCDAETAALIWSRAAKLGNAT